VSIPITWNGHNNYLAWIVLLLCALDLLPETCGATLWLRHLTDSMQQRTPFFFPNFRQTSDDTWATLRKHHRQTRAYDCSNLRPEKTKPKLHRTEKSPPSTLSI